MPVEIPRIALRFEVGEKVQYWSDTYQQWMIGTVQGIYDDGAYDLDIKKAAPANRLRSCRGSVSTPSPPQVAPSHFNLSLKAALASHHSDGNSLPQSARGALATRPSSRGSSRAHKADAEFAHHVDEPRSIVSGTFPRGLPLGSRHLAAHHADDDQSEAFPSRLHKELEQLTMAQAGVSIMNMTKHLLSGAEAAVTQKVAFIMRCLHLWRRETILTHAGVVFQEKFDKHHSHWQAHVEFTKKSFEASFEAELRRRADHMHAHDERVRLQKSLLLDQWAHGENQGLKRQCYIAWGNYSKKQRATKASASTTTMVVNQWVEGQAKGALDTCLQSWQRLTASQREVRQIQAHEKQDAAVKSKLQQIERKHLGGRRTLEIVLAKWEKGSRQGLLSATLKEWRQISSSQARRAKKLSAAEKQINRWLLGNVSGTLGACIKHWQTHVSYTALERMHQAHATALEEAQLKLHEMALFNDQVAAKRHQEAWAKVQYVVAQWELGEKKGRLMQTVRSWRDVVSKAKRDGRQRQSIQDALMRSFMGDKRAAIRMTFTNWLQICKSERAARMEEDRAAEQVRADNQLLAQSQAQCDVAFRNAQDREALCRAQTFQAVELTFRKMMLGEKKGLITTVYTTWKQLVEKERKRQAVCVSMAKWIEGEKRGLLHTATTHWCHYVQLQKSADLARVDQESQANTLRDMESINAKHKKHLMKCAFMWGSRNQAALRRMTLDKWREVVQSASEHAEVDRERTVALQEMHRERETKEAQRKLRVAATLEALGLKSTKVVCTRVYEAWALSWERRRDEQQHRLNKNNVLLKCSEVMLKKKLKDTSAHLLASCFSEWHREGKIMTRELQVDDLQRMLYESKEYAASLEALTAGQQERVHMYSQQVDRMTEALQKELQTKEELADELRHAYDSIRKISITPIVISPTCLPRPISATTVPEDPLLSQSSSQKTIDWAVTDQELSRTRSPRDLLAMRELTDAPAWATTNRLSLPAPQVPVFQPSGGRSSQPSPNISPRQLVTWDGAYEALHNDEDGSAHARLRATKRRQPFSLS